MPTNHKKHKPRRFYILDYGEFQKIPWYYAYPKFFANCDDEVNKEVSIDCRPMNMKYKVVIFRFERKCINSFAIIASKRGHIPNYLLNLNIIKSCLYDSKTQKTQTTV